MLLQQFKTRSAAPTLCSEFSDGFMVRKARSLGRPESLQVRASTSPEGTGWLDSASMAFGEVATYVEKKIGEVKDEFSHEVVDYFGTAVIMKKLKMLDLIDRVADIQDDTSELVGGKHVTVQLVSTDIDPRMQSPNPTRFTITPNQINSAPVWNRTKFSTIYTIVLACSCTLRRSPKVMNTWWLKLDMQTQVNL
jgi:hypothetical protein